MTEAEPRTDLAKKPSGIPPGGAAGVREFFLLRERLASASQRGFHEGAAGWAEFAVGRSALSDAHQLSESREGESTALLLYRSAALLFAQAHAARQQASAGDAKATDALQVSRVRAEVAALPSEQRALVEPALAAAGEAPCATLPDVQRRLLLQALRTLAQALGDSLEAEARPVRQIHSKRRRRIGVAAASVLALAGWAVVKLTWHPNLARGKPVVVTSAEPHVRARPRSLVDGNRRSLGFHTQNLQNQSATIDLGDAKVIHSVVVYNRIDCCQARAVPLRLELSVDGVEYSTIERKTKTFLSWNVAVPGVTARFVRLLHEGKGFFHLAEVEVY